MDNSEKQKLAELIKSADERYGVNNGSQEKVKFTFSLSISEGTNIHYYVLWDLGLAVTPEKVCFGFERLRERIYLVL
ncbi:hypothetical protein ABLA30_08920 [Xenorhabdus nematophila]|uniref:hypothetical protein n=1 Tax=Xenorhabdus nematophila TaxID=628 RepID=UPI0003275479|nr:hypothetical protein [Xenorhabdus nematophila]CCW29056.1 hypothetical protein XNC3_1100009 [Xenorhabdus nematophila F1]